MHSTEGSSTTMTTATQRQQPRTQQDQSGDEPVAPVSMIVFDKLPLSDTCWSLSTGPDDRIYAAACTEHTSGVAAHMVRYTPQGKPGGGRLEYLFDVGEAVGEQADNGRATQCKIHYCLMPEPETGILYGATHLSAAPRGERGYSWFGTWQELHRSYRGSFLFAFDTRNDKLLWSDMCYPWEGSRCMALDPKRRLLHGVAFPRSHYFVYDLEARRHTEYGRTGSVNPQCVWLDSNYNAYTTDDFGYVLRFDAERRRLERLDIRMPFAAYNDGWHTVAYDVVADPTDPDTVYGCSWNMPSHIFRYRMDVKGGPGEMSDFGPGLPDWTYKPKGNFWTDHVGGLVFADRDTLYYTASDMQRDLGQQTPDRRSWLVRMNVRTGESQRIGLIRAGEHKVAYISRAGRTNSGRILLADVLTTPSRMYEFEPEESKNPSAGDVPLRLWG
jgi:hypothetical protein